MLTATIFIEAVLKVTATKNSKYESVLALVRTDYPDNTSGKTPMWLTAPAGSLPTGHISLGATASIRPGRDGRLNIFVRSVATKGSREV